MPSTFIEFAEFSKTDFSRAHTFTYILKYTSILQFVSELCVLRTFGGVDFSLIFICAQSVPEFLWDRLR
eukprot:COSAG02_NODE_2794_length_8016_cov_5.159783_1_plen_68_part_10